MKEIELDLGAFFQNALYELDKLFPSYKSVCENYILQRNAKLVTAPKECLIPAIEIQKAIFAELFKEDVLPLAAMKIIPQAVALGNWRYVQSIYTFDSMLYQTLIQQPLKAIPSELLRKLPEPCLFIRTPDNLFTGLGFFAHFDVKGDEDLYLTLTFQTDPISVISLPLKNSLAKDVLIAILSECRKTLDKATLSYFTKKLNGALQLLLHLCSENVVYDGNFPHQAQNVQEARDVRYFRVGNPGQKENGQSERSMKPHQRKGHLHTYWIGSGDKKKPVQKWVDSTFIHPEKGQDHELH